MRYYCCFYSVNHLGLLVLPWMECQVITDYPLLQVPTSPLSFFQFALTVPQYLCIPDDLGQFTNVDNLTIKSLCLLLCDKLLCLHVLYQMGFTNNNSSMEGIPPVVVDVDMGTLVCTMAVEEETLGGIEGLPGHLLMVSMVCIMLSGLSHNLNINVIVSVKIAGAEF